MTYPKRKAQTERLTDCGRRPSVKAGARADAAKNKPLALAGTLLVMYVITGLALLALAFLLYKLKLGERAVSIGIMTIYVISCLLGGIIAGKRLRTRKFFWGLLVGAIYFFILLVGSLLINRSLNSENVRLILTLFMCMAAGMIGGMIS